MSWNASTSASSYTLRDGISPRAILQKTQSCAVSSMSRLVMRAMPPCEKLALTRVSAGPRRLFPVAGDAFSPSELGKHIRGTQSMSRQQHEAMEPQIGDFRRKTNFITVL